MENENTEKEEVKIEVEPPKNPKEWLKNSLVGFFIGIAVIVPGISGATISIIFKIYDKLLNAVSNLFKKFKNCFLFLLPVVIGAIIGFVGGFFGVQASLNYIPFAIICLFAGLMIGAFPAVTDEIKDAKKTPYRLFLLILSFIIPVVLSIIVALFVKTDEGKAFSTIEWWEYLVFLLIGFAVAVTQIVPGMSATAFLMMIGYFTSLMNSFHLSFWKENHAIFGIYACLGIGFLAGLFIFSKIMDRLLIKHKQATFFSIVGLSAGSIVSIFFNSEIYQVYQIWAGVLDKASTDYSKAVSMSVDLPLGLCLIVVGFVISYLLYRYQKKKDLENKNKSL